MLPAADLSPIIGDGILVLQYEGNLNDAGGTGGHERVSEDGVDHGGKRQRLRVRGHGEASEQDDDARDQVPLRPAVPAPAQPDADKTSTPPDDSHRGVLQVVVGPGPAPAVLCESVDAAPRRNHDRVEEFLAPSRALQPHLAYQEQDGHEDTVADEGTAHDKVRQTLAQVVAAAEAERSDAAEEHLHPGSHRDELARDAMSHHHPPPDPAVEAFLEVQLEVDAEDDLEEDQEHQPGRKAAVDAFRELPALVLMPEDISEDGQDGRD